MNKPTIIGCGTALLTPFSGDVVDYKAYAAMVERQVSAGVDFLVPLGTTGETPTLSDSEKLRILEVTREHAGSLPIVAGVGSNSVQATMENIKLLKDADAFLVVVPFYNKPPQRGIYAYFKTIAENSPKPIILYNVPGRTGSNLEAETTLALARDVPGIIGIKEASGNMEQICAILKDRPEGFDVLSGNDDDTFFLMRQGAEGVISVASNVCPDIMANFVHLLMEGRVEEAEVLDKRLHPLSTNLFVEPNPIPAKAAMAHLGLMQNSLRLPLVPASPQTQDIIQHTLDNLLCSK
ncbi:MAG: 4-hydroxy-tetrahydrodipicolinate synthase [Paludibacteraceae bacterium]|nr:4-hydroxy-tetrahydrodipicolinate synthase [Paludibacteraceae bacterium]